ncbi:peptidase C15 [Methylobacterium gnaphalii]|uniref:Pyroglutamyl-peptidase I n=1 Tax=Methylobacterium gnaphalii TaxID=1010610 RepID=A0A512JLY8_9HYPH|nr:peptidase C15 [Methylobacterium gnaphalii]GEP10968.1 peptidase C15 [Methylobacterium gnaphalii]GJD69746.1 Pyrrolidone-carboxylate peptidase [Methylobacterium gnaphalii]GLS50247.1 peptidase C15 [Methylobacterium gnaphalii]
MNTQKLLIVGFGAFPKVPINPSGLLARRIANAARLKLLLGARPDCRVLRTTYAAVGTELEPALAGAPDAVLMIGVAMRARRIRVESRARNRAHLLFPDADGRLPPHLFLHRTGPTQRTSRHARAALAALRRRGLDAGLSHDAGAYLCNASYYRALAESRPTLFLHIPGLRDAGRPTKHRMSRRNRPLDVWAQAFTDVALMLLVQARTQHHQ